MKKIISAGLVLICVALCFSVAGCGSEYSKFSNTYFDYFDTVSTVTGYAKSKDEFNKKTEKIEELLKEYHFLYTAYSRYDGINNITVINQSEAPVKVDEKIIDMLSFSKEMYTLTEGRVNVAMGSVLSIWHDYRTKGTDNPESAELPPMESLAEAQKHTNIENLEIDKENSTVFLSDSEMSLDVGAIAKGFATEEIAKWMKAEGMTGYLLNIGGNVRAVGNRQDGKKWRVGIENPDLEDTEKPYAEYLEIGDMSLVVSGSYQRYYAVGDKRYHHIIDPDTLMPAEYFSSVSVLCESSALADALSTALFTMSYEKGKRLVSSLEGVYVMWITNEGEQLYSNGFKSFTIENS